MMIKSSLHLSFVLLHKSTYLRSESEKRKKFLGVFDSFAVILDLWNIESFKRLKPASCLGSWGGGGGVSRSQLQSIPAQVQSMQHILTAYSSSSLNEGIF